MAHRCHPVQGKQDIFLNLESEVDVEQLEFCTPEFGHTLANMNWASIRKACIQACLDAMIEERRFTYTDCFIFGAVKR